MVKQRVISNQGNEDLGSSAPGTAQELCELVPEAFMEILIKNLHSGSQCHSPHLCFASESCPSGEEHPSHQIIHLKQLRDVQLKIIRGATSKLCP